MWQKNNNQQTFCGRENISIIFCTVQHPRPRVLRIRGGAAAPPAGGGADGEVTVLRRSCDLWKVPTLDADGEMSFMISSFHCKNPFSEIGELRGQDQISDSTINPDNIGLKNTKLFPKS